MATVAVVVRDSNGTALSGIPVKFYYRDDYGDSTWKPCSDISQITDRNGRAYDGILVPDDDPIKAVIPSGDYAGVESGYLNRYDDLPSVATLIADGQTIDLGPSTQPGSVTASTTPRTYNGNAQVIGSVSSSTGTYYLGLAEGIQHDSATGQDTYSGTITWGPANTSLSATNAGSYVVCAKCDAATGYDAVAPFLVNVVSISKASNQISVSPTTATIYDRSGYNTVGVTVSGYKGTVTASSSNTSKATVSKNSNASFTITYAGAGSATITFTDTSTNYATSSATCTVTTVADYVTNPDYSGSNSSYWASISIGSGITAGGGSATVTASAGHTHTYYYLYASGYVSGPYTSAQSDSVTWSISSQYMNSSSNTITRFSKSGNTLSHSTMGTTTGTDYVTVTAVNSSSSSATDSASTSVTNDVTNYDYNASNGSYWADVSIGSGMTAAGGSATVTPSAWHSAYDYYTSGSYNNSHTVNDSVSWDITSQTFNTSTAITRFSKSGNTLSHSSMGTSVGIDKVTVTATNSTSSSGTASASKEITNSLESTNYSPSDYTASISVGSGLSAGTSGATVTTSASHKAYDYYTSGTYNNQHTVNDTATWSISSQYMNSSSNTISRYSKSGDSLNHSTMGSTVGTDYAVLSVVNNSDSSGSSSTTVSVVNVKESTNYSPSDYTASISIGSGLTAAGGSATVSASAQHYAYDYYTSGTYTNQHVVSDSVTWDITSNGNSRFSKSGNTLSHSSMGVDETTDSVTVTATNSSYTSAKASDTKSIGNPVTSISLSVGGSTDSKSIDYGESTTTSVTATYASGASTTVTPTTLTSSDTTVAIIS